MKATLISAVLCLGLTLGAAAQPDSVAQSRSMATGSAQTVPEPLRDVGFEQRLGERLDLEARLLDHQGRELARAELFGERPVLFVPVYYDCPMLCSLVLDGVVRQPRQGAPPLPPGAASLTSSTATGASSSAPP